MTAIVTEHPTIITSFPLAMGNEEWAQTWVDTTSRHHLLRIFHLVLSTPEQAKGPKDPRSSLWVELQLLALADASCLLPLAWLCSLNTLFLGRCGRLEHSKAMEEDFWIYHSSILWLHYSFKKDYGLNKLRRKKDKNGISGGKNPCIAKELYIR